MAEAAFGGCMTFFAVVGALAGEALFLTYGILALIPGPPFTERNLTVGVTLVVLAGVGLAAIGGAIAGAISAFLLGGLGAGTALLGAGAVSGGAALCNSCKIQNNRNNA